MATAASHTYTHRGRSLDNPKPRQGAGTFSSPDLAGVRPASPRRWDPPLSKSASGSCSRAEDQAKPTLRAVAGMWDEARTQASVRGTPSDPPPTSTSWSNCLEPGKSARTALGMGVDAGARSAVPARDTPWAHRTRTNFGGSECLSSPPHRVLGDRKEKAVTFTVLASPRARTQASLACCSAVPGCSARSAPSSPTITGPGFGGLQG